MPLSGEPAFSKFFGASLKIDRFAALLPLDCHRRRGTRTPGRESYRRDHQALEVAPFHRVGAAEKQDSPEPREHTASTERAPLRGVPFNRELVFVRGRADTAYDSSVTASAAAAATANFECAQSCAR